MKDRDGKPVGYIPGVNWNKVKRYTRLTKGGRVAFAEDKIAVLNKAIHEFIVLKKRYMAANEPSNKTRAIQVEIDKLMKQKRVVLDTERYLEWMRRKNVT